MNARLVGTLSRPAIALAVSLSFGPLAHAAVIAGPVVNPANGHAYYAIGYGTFSVLETMAVGMGGHLATVNDAAENAWIVGNVGPLVPANGLGFKPAFIGLNDVAAEGVPVWVSGESSGFTSSINPDSPNNGSNDAVFLYMATNTFSFGPPFPDLAQTAGEWAWAEPNGGQFGSSFVGIVEVVPEPTSLGTLAFAIALRRRRRTNS